MRRRQTPALIRRHLNLGADYVLRCVGLLSDVFGGDIISGLVFLAAVQASTQHLRNSSAQDDCEEEFFPDEVRRPASLSAIARSASRWRPPGDMSSSWSEPALRIAAKGAAFW